jgi:ribosomal protein S18 acetylase RimI-like enzyme
VNPPCPFLPPIDRPHSAADVNRFPKSQRGPDFYLACLLYAQSLWQSGLPAQAILQCNRALSLPLGADEPVLRRWPLPYLPLAWIVHQRPAGQFIGNPRRHWQHLATRMVEPHKDLRTWRAWACWYLAKTLLPEAGFPGDSKQIREEAVIEPAFDQIFDRLGRLSPANDLPAWQHALKWSRDQLPPSWSRDQLPPSTAPGTPPLPAIRVIGPAELPTLVNLARPIWNACYPGIISQAQIDYMLSVWYQPDALLREMTGRGAVFALIESDHTPVGYIGLEPRSQDRVLFLSKLYLLPQYHGIGLGRFALDWVKTQAAARHCSLIRLRVNKNNAPAIRAYLRAGFHFVEDLCSDIGNGFVMDDYLLELPLP